MSVNTLAVHTAAPLLTGEPPHVIELERQAGLVRAVCTTCDWTRFGAWYPTRTVEGWRLAEQDGEMHLRNPEIPAYRPAGW